MQNIPTYVSIVFIIATLYSVMMFWKGTNYSKTFIIVLSLWLLIQGITGYSLFYTETRGMPPRLFLLVVPPLIAIMVLFLSRKGRSFIDSLHVPSLLLMNVVRIPVEIVLFWLFIDKAVPEIMTFEGNNFDIFSGLTAPLVWFLARRQNNSKLLLTWNIICLALLVNIVTTAILAAPFDFQQIAFDQPNIGVLYFPFVWLPGVIVPLVLLSHLAMIRKALIKKSSEVSLGVSV
jgi:hypothetical protein